MKPRAPELPHVTGPRYDDLGNKIADGLLAWAGIYYPGYTPADIQQYYNRGQFIDAACNLIGTGQKLHAETLNKAQAEGWIGFIEAYRDFLDKEEFVLIDYAVHVVNRIERYQGTYDQRFHRRYAGTFDNHSIGQGEEILIDLKTGKAPAWTALQLAFYLLALGDTLYRRIQRAALELHADGTYELIPYNGFKDFDKARLLSRAYWTAQEYR